MNYTVQIQCFQIPKNILKNLDSENGKSYNHQSTTEPGDFCNNYIRLNYYYHYIRKGRYCIAHLPNHSNEMGLMQLKTKLPLAYHLTNPVQLTPNIFLHDYHEKKTQISGKGQYLDKLWQFEEMANPLLRKSRDYNSQSMIWLYFVEVVDIEKAIYTV
ncbi:hypothetical protein LOD99_5341 [Oopsacas minuta]|uniref:Uncharacterized protein n=1 Tax=Oopsacas minuta TaxID=111878 RepID=A0AAV7JR72_9METZ|nr:hypothetical protein LOD99_5341 [Oopsacas minuta]